MWEGAEAVSETLVDTTGGDVDRSKGLALSALKERLNKATSPAVDRLTLRLEGFEPAIRDRVVKAREGGVNVWDVVDETFEALATSLPGPFCQECEQWHTHSDEDSEGGQYLGVLSRTGDGLAKERPKSAVEAFGWDSYAVGLWGEDGEIYTTDAECEVSKGRVVLVLELTEPD